MGDDLIKAKVGLSAEGGVAELAVGEDVPRVLARLFPAFAARKRATRMISTSILEKVRAQEVLDPAELGYVRAVFGDEEAKFIRKSQIFAKAQKTLEGKIAAGVLPPLPAMASSDEGGTDAKETSEDWISRFWDDAGLVSDEQVQEIYARILASEAPKPGSCSLRTLRVLRYMDRQTADKFARLMPAIIGHRWVIRDPSLEEALGISFGLVHDLDDAGLIDCTGIITTWNLEPTLVTYGTMVLALKNAVGLKFQNYPLTEAGRQLSRIADTERTKERLFKMARWLTRQKEGVEAFWAALPSADYQGPTNALEWFPVPPATEVEPDKLLR